MYQWSLIAFKCRRCGKNYSEMGYWRDGEYCPECSANMRGQEENRKRELSKQAAAAAEKYGLDLRSWPEEIPGEIRRELNPKNAGRKEVKYDENYCELLVEDAAEGKSEAEFAARIMVSQGLLQYWTARHPRFRRAREIANELRRAWLERTYRDAMVTRIPCQPSMMIRYAAAKLGWSEKNDATISAGSGEIPVVKIVERDAGFPSETVEPTREQADEAGLA